MDRYLYNQNQQASGEPTYPSSSHRHSHQIHQNVQPYGQLLSGLSHEGYDCRQPIEQGTHNMDYTQRQAYPQSSGMMPVSMGTASGVEPNAFNRVHQPYPPANMSAFQSGAGDFAETYSFSRDLRVPTYSPPSGPPRQDMPPPLTRRADNARSYGGISKTKRIGSEASGGGLSQRRQVAGSSSGGRSGQPRQTAHTSRSGAPVSCDPHTVVDERRRGELPQQEDHRARTLHGRYYREDFIAPAPSRSAQPDPEPPKSKKGELVPGAYLNTVLQYYVNPRTDYIYWGSDPVQTLLETQRTYEARMPSGFIWDQYLLCGVDIANQTAWTLLNGVKGLESRRNRHAKNTGICKSCRTRACVPSWGGPNYFCEHHFWWTHEEDVKQQVAREKARREKIAAAAQPPVLLQK